MSTLASIDIAVKARTGEVRRGLDAAAASINRFGHVTGHAGRHLLALAGGLGAVLSLHGFIRFIEHSFEAAASLSALASRLGIATDKMGGLQLAGAEAHIDIETLSKALQFLGKNLSIVAQTGKGPAASALSTLGLNAKKLVSLSPDEQLLAIADAMESISNQSDRLRLTLAIFGKGGGPLAALFGEGGSMIRQAIDDAKKLGFAFGEIDAAKVELAHEAMVKLQFAFKGIGTQIVLKIAPLLEYLIDLMVNFGQEGGGVASFVSSAFQTMGSAAVQFADILDALVLGWKAVELASAKALTASSGFIKDLTTGNGMSFTDNIRAIFGLPTGSAKDSPMGKPESFLGESFSAGVEQMRSRVKELEQEVSEAWIAPSLGQKLKGFFAEVFDKSYKRATERAKLREGRIGALSNLEESAAKQKMGAHEPQFPFAQIGTQESFAVMLKALNQFSDPTDDLLKQQLAEEKKQAEQLKKMNAFFENFSDQVSIATSVF